jgi:exopolysaccharide biosynthesis polyprenyl glycosylphosphotransferase
MIAPSNAPLKVQDTLPTMSRHDRFAALSQTAAMATDALAVFGGIMLAIWLRFFSDWIPLHKPLPPLELYWQGAGIATMIFVLVFAAIGLYERPQRGTFSDQIPRLVRGVLWGIGLAMVLAFAVRTDPPFSRLTTALSFFTILGLVLLERYILFGVELLIARRRGVRDGVAILGVGERAVELHASLENDPRLRCRVTAFLQLDADEPDARIPEQLIQGTPDDLGRLLASGKVTQVMLSELRLGRDELVRIADQCERAMVSFYIVPDLFGILTSRVEIRHVDGIPLLGIGNWPLDRIGNRLAKRTIDLVGATVGLIVSAPLFLLLAVLIRRDSPGPVFYRQERCGEGSRRFTMHKLRTMHVDAEAGEGPAWSRRADPRCTRIGAFLRRYSLDELPQFWNVLKGDMSLVGPRPERPHFVDRFREDISNYMWRHVFKPGMTGWAQVNGYRGDTDLQARIRHDLYYLENWSLAFDFKILLRTLFAQSPRR